MTEYKSVVLLGILAGSLAWGCGVNAQGAENDKLPIKVSEKILDGGVYYLDDLQPLNGLTVGLTITNTSRPSKQNARKPINNGLAYMIKIKKSNAVNIRDMLDIPDDVVFDPEKEDNIGKLSLEEMKSHLDPAAIAKRMNKTPDEVSFDNSDVWVKWERSENSLDDFWRLGISYKIPENSPIQYVDFLIKRKLTKDDKIVMKALLKSREQDAFQPELTQENSTPDKILPDVIIKRLDSFDSVVPMGTNSDGYLDAGESSQVIPVNVGHYYNFTRPGTYTLSAELYGPANRIKADNPLTFRVLPFRKTSLSFKEVQKDVNDRPAGPPLYPWLIYETLAEDGVHEIVYSQRRFQIGGNPKHDFYRLCRVMPGTSVQVGQKDVYRAVVYAQTENGRFIYSEINFDYRYPLVTIRYMKGDENISRTISPDGELNPPLN